VTADPLRAERQAGIVDTNGEAATHTGESCFAWAGGRIGAGYAAQGNILAGAAVVEGLANTWLGGGAAFPELLVRCLAAADAAGGDRRGRESAALLVVRAGGGYGGGNDRWIDLRVDDHPDPIGELARILELQRLYFDRPAPEDLLPLDEGLAAEIRAHLERAGAGPGSWTASIYAPMSGNAAVPDGTAERPAIGEPRPLPDGWDGPWHDALIDWMAVENLEERAAAQGWIDPRVLAYMRSKVPGR
jgi:uncharacterized Ntn-hydrolase superfamily protein